MLSICGFAVKYCPYCADVLTGSEKVCSSCGGKLNRNEEEEYPTLNGLCNELATILSSCEHPFNYDPYIASKQWLKITEPLRQNEAPRTLYTKTGKVWIWPYADFRKALLIKFIALDKVFQNQIIAASEDEIYWRGEDQKGFNKLIDETLNMREDRESYIKGLKNKLKEFFKK